MKRQPKEQEKIFANNISNTGLIFKTYRELVQFNNKKITQLKIGNNLSRVHERPNVHGKILDITSHQGNSNQSHSKLSLHIRYNSHHQKDKG